MNMRSVFTCMLLAGSLCLAWPLSAAEIVRLTAENWDEFIPQGKEVDAIYGDFVLRNEQLVAVIAQPVPGRNANMTVRTVGGMIIDLTCREPTNDQLSCYYPGAAYVEYVSLEEAQVTVDGRTIAAQELQHAEGKTIVLQCKSVVADGKPQATNRYTLEEGRSWLVAETEYANPHRQPLSLDLLDSIRADRYFTFGNDSATGMFWAVDDWFGQAYGVICEGREIRRMENNRSNLLQLAKDGQVKVTLAPGEGTAVSRKVFPARDLLELRGRANAISGRATHPVRLQVTDPAGAVGHALVTLKRQNVVYGKGRTNAAGVLEFGLEPGEYAVTVEGLGRPAKAETLVVNEAARLEVKLEGCGYVEAQVTDDEGRPLPCKVAFHGKDGTATPNFAPDGAAGPVGNLVYTAQGTFRQEIGPGTYQVIISYGPEYDAVFTELQVERGKTAQLTGKLKRTVDTRGWVSSDFHSHSSPSGDNASSQLGRVLNLLCEHVEFAPCTEHNRIDSYAPLLEQLGVAPRMATCTGMELTGSPLPINHQNAFPLVHKPRTQDGGAPVTDANPVVQIERLALWDNGSDKLVQQNHPNLVQMLADKDEDGKADGGFAQMFGFMDVVEVHPPQGIFTPPTRDAGGKLSRNPIFHWMQMLNLGYRIAGVVNTDAHYTLHGSGWMRNYIKSSTDDPAQIDTLEMVHASEQGRVVMSTGPFLEVEFAAARAGDRAQGGPGDSVAAPGGKGTLRIRVQCPNWFDVNRVQIFVNGRPDARFNWTRRTAADKFGNGVVKFEQTVDVELESDAHLIVATIGEGLSLGPVFGDEWGKSPPVAVANPIFVDVNGDGFQANGDLLELALPLEKTETKVKPAR